MKKNVLNRQYITDVAGVAKSSSPISQAVVVGNQCWISGQLSFDQNGHYWPGSTYEEATRAFDAVFKIAEASGFSPSEIVFIDIAFIDLNDIQMVNQLYNQLFPEGRRPARTIYQAARLPFDGKIKVQAIAAKS